MDNRDIFNHEFLHEVEEWRGSNALLILIDGSLVFGSIGRFDDDFLAILPPFNVAGIVFAVHRPPASPTAPDVVAQEVWVRGDDIAAVFTGAFTSLPFVLSPTPTVVVAFNARVFAQYEVHEPFIHELMERLAVLEGQNVKLHTLGGWQITGRLGEVKKCLVWIGPVAIMQLPPFIAGAIGISGAAVPGGVILAGIYRGLVNVVSLIGIE